MNNKKEVNDFLRQYFAKQAGTLPKRKPTSLENVNKFSARQICSLRKEDYLELIDMALAIGDKDWFMELTERMKGAA